MTSLLDSVAPGAIQADRAGDVLPDRDALLDIYLERLAERLPEGMAGSTGGTKRRVRLPRVGATSFEMAARYRDLVDAGLHDPADAMLDAWEGLS